MTHLTWSDLSERLRASIIAAHEEGVSADELAARYNVRASSLGRKLRLLKSAAPGQRRRHDGIDTRIVNYYVQDMIKVLIYTDPHFPYADMLALEAVLEIADMFQPDMVVNLGDTLDLQAFSRYAKTEAATSLSEDRGMWKDWAAELNSVIGADKEGKGLIVKGNHDERIYSALSPALGGMPEFTLDQLLYTDELGYLPVAEMICINPDSSGQGMLYLTHGKYASTVAGQAGRKMSERLAYSNVVVGHNHKNAVTMHRTPRGTVKAYELGCLQRLDPSWDLYPNWSQGVITGYIWSNGFHLDIVPIDQGKYFFNGAHHGIGRTR